MFPLPNFFRPAAQKTAPDYRALDAALAGLDGSAVSHKAVRSALMPLAKGAQDDGRIARMAGAVNRLACHDLLFALRTAETLAIGLAPKDKAAFDSQLVAIVDNPKTADPENAAASLVRLIEASAPAARVRLLRGALTHAEDSATAADQAADPVPDLRNALVFAYLAVTQSARLEGKDDAVLATVLAESGKRQFLAAMDRMIAHDPAAALPHLLRYATTRSPLASVLAPRLPAVGAAHLPRAPAKAIQAATHAADLLPAAPTEHKHGEHEHAEQAHDHHDHDHGHHADHDDHAHPHHHHEESAPVALWRKAVSIQAETDLRAALGEARYRASISGPLAEPAAALWTDLLSKLDPVAAREEIFDAEWLADRHESALTRAVARKLASPAADAPAPALPLEPAVQPG